MTDLETECSLGHGAAGAVSLSLALCGGLLAGFVAQFLRQIVGPLSLLGGATAPWVTMGFVLAVLAARRRPLADGVVWASAVVAAYLLCWLVSYHALFAVRGSVGPLAAWAEARSWVVVLAPASFGLGLVAARSTRGGWIGDVCLGLPIACSTAEIMAGMVGVADALAVGLPTVVLAAVPTALCWNRRPRLVVVAAVATVGIAVAQVLAHCA